MAVMMKDFIERVKREELVETKKYRYIRKEFHDVDSFGIRIERLPLTALGTTDAINGWETVYEEKYYI